MKIWIYIHNFRNKVNFTMRENEEMNKISLIQTMENMRRLAKKVFILFFFRNE